MSPRTWRILNKDLSVGRLEGLKILVRNKKIMIGLVLIVGFYIFAEVGSRLTPYEPRRMGDVPINLPPSWEHPLGSDPMGRDIFSQLLHGSILSIQIGFMAGTIAFILAALLAVIAGYYGGIIDNIVSLATEVFITIPSLAILILIAALFGRISVPIMSLILAAFGWAFPCKVLRSQTLSLKERGFVKLAKLSGLRGPEIVVKVILPNMLTFLGAWFAFVVVGAMVAEAALEFIGLGPPQLVSLGLMLYWASVHAAFSRGIVNWWLPPCFVLILMFLALALISMGLDEVGNPKLRQVK